MPIYINDRQQTTGPYEESTVLAWLQTGQISPDTLACPQGATQWQPLRILFPVPGQPAAFTSVQPPGAAPTAQSQAVVNWARQSFPARVEVRMKFVDAGLGNLTKYLDAEGVETRNGARHRWETLQYISYRQERPRSLVTALMTRGQQRLSARLTFQTGEAIVTPFMQNSDELLARFETLPVERRKY